jgi:probable F420-dependent oxidoreductase
MKIKVGFGLGTNTSLDGAAFWTLIDACESLGWDSIWFSERATGPTFGPIAAMAAAAGRTRRLKFGTSVLVLPGRNPVLLAKELATIDVVSNGRIIPAFGLGIEDPHEQEAFGVDRSEAPTRSEEAVALIRRLWSEPEVTHEGRHFRVTKLRLEPRPVQQPHPDMWFGGYSKAAIRRTATLGTGWLPSFITPSEYRDKAAAIRARAEEAGRTIDDEHFGALLAYRKDGDSPRAEAFLKLIAARRPDMDPRDLIVFGADGLLRERIEKFIEVGASKFVVVPLVTPEDWGAELAELHAKVVRPLEGKR